MVACLLHSRENHVFQRASEIRKRQIQCSVPECFGDFSQAKGNDQSSRAQLPPFERSTDDAPMIDEPTLDFNRDDHRANPKGVIYMRQPKPCSNRIEQAITEVALLIRDSPDTSGGVHMAGWITVGSDQHGRRIQEDFWPHGRLGELPSSAHGRIGSGTTAAGELDSAGFGNARRENKNLRQQPLDEAEGVRAEGARGTRTPVCRDPDRLALFHFLEVSGEKPRPDDGVSADRAMVARDAAEARNNALGAALKGKPREVRGVRLHCAIGAGVPATVSSSIKVIIGISAHVANKTFWQERCVVRPKKSPL